MNMPAGKFKAKCLKLMDHVREHHDSVVITKRGKPVAKLVPWADEPTKDLFGYLKDSVVIRGDVVGPTGEKWKVDD